MADHFGGEKRYFVKNRAIVSSIAHRMNKTNDTWAERPYTDITFGKTGVRHAALYDTGANVSILHTDTFRAAQRQGRVVHKLKNGLNVTNASGKTMHQLGVFQISFEIQDRTLVAPFVVSDDLNGEAIIGMNIIARFNLGFDANTSKVVFKNDGLAEPAFGTINAVQAFQEEGQVCVVVHKKACIHPRNNGKVRCFLRRADGTKIAKSTEFMADLAIVNVLHRSDASGLFEIYVPNAAYDDDMDLPRGTVLGTASAVANVHFITAEEADEGVANVAAADGAPPGPNRPAYTPPTPEQEAALQEKLDKAVDARVPPMLRQRYLHLLRAKARAFSVGKHDLGYTEAVQHGIQLRDEVPVHQKQFRLAADHLEVIKDNVANWLRLGIVQPSNSKYNAPIFCVPKPNGDLRTVLDYRGVNSKSMPDKYCIRSVDECLEEVGNAGSTIFSVCDVTAGFWQMCLEPASRPLTAFTIPGVGQMEWTTAPMGLSGSPASFCRLMDLILKDLANVIAYVDDVLTHSSNHHDHLQTLASVLQRFIDYNVRLNPSKCVFGTTSVQYLGRTIDGDGVSPGLHKTKAILDCKPPSTVRQIKAFAGLANYFRGFVENFATKAGPLFRILRKESEWAGGALPPAALKAFHTLRHEITTAPTLALPNRNGKYHLYVDAAAGDDVNTGGLGAVLWQEQPSGAKKVVAYASRGLVKHEGNYPPYLLEMAAAVFGMTTWSTLLLGRHFDLYTDHKPLVRLSSVHTKTLNRLQLLMQEMHPNMKYVDGDNNTVADFLSRYHGMAAAKIDASNYRVRELQHLDTHVRSIIDHGNGLFDKAFADLQDFECGTCTYRFNQQILQIRTPNRKGFLNHNGGWRVLVPNSMKKEIVGEAHGSSIAGHGGIFKTAERIRAEFYWPNMEKDIAQHIAACPPCQATTNKGVVAPPPLRPVPLASEPGKAIHVDTFGPLKSSGKNNNKYVCVITDSFTKMVWMAPMPTNEAMTAASAILQWIYTNGLPNVITTDQGGEYCNELNRAIWDGLDITHNVTTPYYPQANAAVERKNHDLAHILKTAIYANSKDPLDWELHLGPVQLCYNSAVHKSTRVSPFYATFGHDARIPLWDGPIDIADEEITDARYAEYLLKLRTAQYAARKAVQSNTGHARDVYKQNFDKTNRVAFTQFAVGDTVWVRINDRKAAGRANPKLAARWEPGTIVEHVKLATYRVSRINRKRRKVITLNVQQLKPRRDAEVDSDEYEAPDLDDDSSNPTANVAEVGEDSNQTSPYDKETFRLYQQLVSLTRRYHVLLGYGAVPAAQQPQQPQVPDLPQPLPHPRPPPPAPPRAGPSRPGPSVRGAAHKVKKTTSRMLRGLRDHLNSGPRDTAPQQQQQEQQQQQDGRGGRPRRTARAYQRYAPGPSGAFCVKAQICSIQVRMPSSVRESIDLARNPNVGPMVRGRAEPAQADGFKGLIRHSNSVRPRADDHRGLSPGSWATPAATSVRQSDSSSGPAQADKLEGLTGQLSKQDMVRHSVAECPKADVPAKRAEEQSRSQHFTGGTGFSSLSCPPVLSPATPQLPLTSSSSPSSSPRPSSPTTSSSSIMAVKPDRRRKQDWARYRTAILLIAMIATGQACAAKSGPTPPPPAHNRSPPNNIRFTRVGLTSYTMYHYTVTIKVDVQSTRKLVEELVDTVEKVNQQREHFSWKPHWEDMRRATLKGRVDQLLNRAADIFTLKEKLPGTTDVTNFPSPPAGTAGHIRHPRFIVTLLVFLAMGAAIGATAYGIYHFDELNTMRLAESTMNKELSTSLKAGLQTSTSFDKLKTLHSHMIRAMARSVNEAEGTDLETAVLHAAEERINDHRNILMMAASTQRLHIAALDEFDARAAMTEMNQNLTARGHVAVVRFWTDLLQVPTSFVMTDYGYDLLLHVPAYTPGTILTIYRHIPVPFRLDHAGKYSYMVHAGNVDHIAIDTEAHLFRAMTTAEMLQCRDYGNQMFVCANSNVVTKGNAFSDGPHYVLSPRICIYAMQQQRLALINATCHGTIRESEHDIHQLNPTDFVVTTTEPHKGTISCDDPKLQYERRFSAYHGELIKLKPGCTGQTRHNVFYAPPDVKLRKWDIVFELPIDIKAITHNLDEKVFDDLYQESKGISGADAVPIQEALKQNKEVANQIAEDIEAAKNAPGFFGSIFNWINSAWGSTITGYVGCFIFLVVLFLIFKYCGFACNRRRDELPMHHVPVQQSLGVIDPALLAQYYPTNTAATAK